MRNCPYAHQSLNPPGHVEPVWNLTSYAESLYGLPSGHRVLLVYILLFHQLANDHIHHVDMRLIFQIHQVTIIIHDSNAQSVQMLNHVLLPVTYGRDVVTQERALEIISEIKTHDVGSVELFQ
jgi:hypothetical protein